MKKQVNVAVTGAAGQIGYALVFRIASGQLLGSDVEVNLRMLELPQAMAALDGIAMELEDCAFPLLKSITCTDQLSVAMDGSNWNLLVGSVPRKAGMERSDLLASNGKIFTAQGKAINDYAADDVQTLVVGNPCNTNSLIAMNNAPDVPRDRWFAMTALDEHRAAAQLAKKMGVSINDIRKIVIWGNHSSTQYPDFYHAEVQGKLAHEVMDENWLQGEFIQTVQQRGAAIIKARGASSAASAANAAITTVHQLSQENTADGNWFSVAKCSNGEYGIPEGLIFSFPSRMENGKLVVIEGLAHNEFAKEKIDLTCKELCEERDTVKELGLID